MDIDIELFKIIKKYDIYRYIPEAEAVYMTALAFRLLEDKILNYPEEAVIAMRGGGIHFKKMWELMTEKAKRRIAYIFDRNINGDLCIPIIDPDEIDKYHIDVIILASWKFRDEFIDEFMERKGQYEIVDPYEYWMENGLRFYCEFYNEPAYQHLHVTYVDINRSLFLYRTTKNDNAKKYNLEKAIAQCIEVKNFIYVEKYVREYIGNGWDSDNRIKQFFNDIHNLLEHIQDVAGKREQKDIVINWVDNVNAEEFYGTSFFKGIRDRSIVFMNAFTVTPWTHFTMRTMMTGKVVIDDNTYMIDSFDKDNSPVLSMLYDSGYGFMYIANPGLYQNMYAKECLPEYPNGFKKVILNERSISDCSSRLQWTSLRYRLMSEKPVCHLIHNLAEVHIPFIFIDIDSMGGDRMPYRIQGLNFISDQLRFYDKFYSHRSHQIYLADHGEGMKYGKSYVRGRTNIPFVITQKKGKAFTENRLYSHKNFSSIIKAILSGNELDYDDCFEDYVLYQNIDFYSQNAIDSHILRWIRKESPIDMANYQSRGIRTEEDMYVTYSEGPELYFRLPDESKNLINEEEWGERINELRNKCGRDFIDRRKTPLFKYTQVLYDYLDMVNDNTVY